MYIQDIIERIPYRSIGIQLAHHSSDRYNKRIVIYDAKTILYLSGFTIATAVLEHHQSYLNNTIVYTSSALSLSSVKAQDNRQYTFLLLIVTNKYSVYYSLVCVNVVQAILFLYSLLYLSYISSTPYRLIDGIISRLDLPLKTCFHNSGHLAIIEVASVIVSALYASGTLVIVWTTFLNLLPPRRNFSVQLAVVCLVLATLTIAARCYASSSTTTNNNNNIITLSNADVHHPLVKLNNNNKQQQQQQQQPITSFSPIYNYSNNAQFYSSNLVLRRLFNNINNNKSSHQFVQSDTSVIVLNSKKLLYNQNSNNTNQFRTKRELKSSAFNYITKTISYYSTEATFFNNNNNKDKFSNNNLISTNLKKRLPPRAVLILNLKKRSDGKSDVSNSATKDNNNKIVSDNSVVNATKVKNISRLNNAIEVDQQLNDSHFPNEAITRTHTKGTEWPMPPVHDHSNASSVNDLGILVLVLSAIVLTVALGLITCVLSHYRSVTGLGAADGGTAANPYDAAQTPTTAPMLSVVSVGAAAGVGGMDRLRSGRAARELAATRDHQVRLHAVHTDIAINLPPSIAMPDGEEHPFTSSRLHLRDPEQESEIHQKCIRPPPNRTVLESESPPPYRSSSAGVLGSSGVGGGGGGGGGGCGGISNSSSSTGSNDWLAAAACGGGGSAPLVVRCNSMSSSSSLSSSACSSSTISSTSSITKRPETSSSSAGIISSVQKTDFLQRTVNKIFTTGKNKSQQPTAPTLPVVIVPTRQRRTVILPTNDQQQQQQQQPQQQQQQQMGRPKPPSV